jgi:hypothetical protein
MLLYRGSSEHPIGGPASAAGAAAGSESAGAAPTSWYVSFPVFLFQQWCHYYCRGFLLI